MLRAKPLRDEPTQEDWLGMSLVHRGYWLLKMIDHYRDQNTFNPEPRTKYAYHKSSCLVNSTSIDHHNDDVISAIDQGFTWLHSNGYIREAPSQPDGFYQITNMGIDLVELRRTADRNIDTLIDFVNRKAGLPNYEAQPVDILRLFVSGMERTGDNEDQFQLTIDEQLAVNLSLLNEQNITVESLRKATDTCKARRWLKSKYMGSGNYGQLHITLAGIQHHDENKESTMPQEPQTKTETDANVVFIVHGHDSALKNEVAVFLTERGLTHKILSNVASSGRTVIEKFEAEADNPQTAFAVLLFTADDEGKANTETEYKKRARQNVVLEAGYFFGKLGRERTAILAAPEVELPSDIAGMVYTSTGNWQMQLAQELAAAGLPVSL